MSNVAHIDARLTPQQYLAIEQDGTVKHEYVDGYVYAMSGASDRHNLVTGDLFAILLRQVKPPCQVFIGAMKLRVRRDDATFFYYPDILIGCSPKDADRYFRDEPILLVETLSPSTTRTDRLEKLQNYKGIQSLQDYLLVDQDIPKVELFSRRNAWQPQILMRGETITIDGLGVAIAVSDIYSRVDF